MSRIALSAAPSMVFFFLSSESFSSSRYLCGLETLRYGARQTSRQRPPWTRNSATNPSFPWKRRYFSDGHQVPPLNEGEFPRRGISPSLSATESILPSFLWERAEYIPSQRGWVSVVSLYRRLALTPFNLLPWTGCIFFGGCINAEGCKVKKPFLSSSFSELENDFAPVCQFPSNPSKCTGPQKALFAVLPSHEVNPPPHQQRTADFPRR